MDHPFGYILNNKIFRKGFMDNPDREIGEVRGTPEESIMFFEERFRVAELKVAELEGQIASYENKGSFLAKLIHLKKTLAEFDGLGNFEKLVERLRVQEIYLEELIGQNRIKNLEIKRALLDDLENLKDQFNLREGSEKIKEISAKWIRTGAVPSEYQQETDDKYNVYINLFYQRKKSFFEDRKKMFDDYIQQYKNLITRVRNLSPNYKKDSRDSVYHIIKEWKNLPKIPGTFYIPLRDEFRKYIGYVERNSKKEVRPEFKINMNEVVAEKHSIISELMNCLTDFNTGMDKIENIKTKWKNLPRVNSKEVKLLDKKAFDLFNKINELNFIYDLSCKKNRDFRKLPADKQTGMLVRLLDELVTRERKELEKVENNSGIIYSHDRKVQDMLGRQVQIKIRRIETKSALMNDLNEGKIRINISE